MNDNVSEEMSKEEIGLIPTHLKLRLGFIKLQAEKAKQQEEQQQQNQQDPEVQKQNQEQEKQEERPVTAYELIRLGLERQLEKEQLDALDD